MTGSSKASPRRRSTVQAQPIKQRSFGGYVRNGKIPAVMLLLGAGWLLYATLTSPRYVVQQVRLEGGNALMEADVAALSAVQGQSIWNVEPSEVEARVAQSPYVEQASAQVVLPATVLVRVRERQPAMRWQHNDTVYDVAQDGRILAAAPNASLASPSASVAGTDVVTATAPISPTSSVAPVPRVISGNSVVVIDTTPDRVLEPGSYVDPDALEVARRVALRAAELPAPLEQIRWEQNIGVVLQVGGRTVVVGNSERLDEKLAILVKVLREQTPFTLLDLRPSAPYLR
jgi:cell division protein FtsQ